MIELDEIKAALAQQPFIPFEVMLTRGHRVPVESPAQTLLTRTVLLVGTPVGSDGIADAFTECPLQRIYQLVMMGK